MKSKCMMIAVCSAAIWLGMPEPSFGEPETYVVIVTAYTCEAHPSNPMYPCGPLRWGGDIHGPGMACPVAWRDRVMVVPGYGTLRCDDTPREGFLYGLPHLDLRVSTVAEARRIGVRRMSVRSAAALQPNAPAGGVATEAEAIQFAHTRAPSGDISTAIARRLHAARARQHFAGLFGAVDLPAEHPVWLVALWVPASEIPEGAVAQPEASAEIAARFFAFDAGMGALVAEAFVSKDVVETLGWLSQDTLENSGQ